MKKKFRENKLCSLIGFVGVQSVGVTNPATTGRVRLEQCIGDAAVRGARRQQESGAPKVQLLHLRVRPSSGATRRASAVHAKHCAYLLACLGWLTRRWERHRHRLGSTIRGRNSTWSTPTGKPLSQLPRLAIRWHVVCFWENCTSGEHVSRNTFKRILLFWLIDLSILKILLFHLVCLRNTSKIFNLKGNHDFKGYASFILFSRKDIVTQVHWYLYVFLYKCYSYFMLFSNS